MYRDFPADRVQAVLRGEGPVDSLAGVVLSDPGRFAGPLLEVERDGITVSLRITEFRTDLDEYAFGQARFTVQLVELERGEIRDVLEQELSDGCVDPGDLDVPLADPAPVLEQWARGWRARLEHRWGTRPMPADLQPEAGLIPLLRAWALDGPPGPRPHRLRLDPEDIARGATEIRAVPLELARAVDRWALAAYEIRGWRVVIAPYVSRPESFEEDRVWVQRVADGAAAVVLMSDPWDTPVQMTVDGDAVAFRDAATWLREVVVRAGLDVAWVDPAEDEDEEPTACTVSEWLRFRDGWREQDGEALIDWRVQPEMVADEVRFWESGIYGLNDETRARHAAGIALWHAFVREVLDPTFVARVRRPG